MDEDAWITEPLLKTFRNQNKMNNYFSNNITIDGTLFDMYISERSMQDLISEISFCERAGYMLTYDVTDEDTFETAKQIASSLHPKKVSIHTNSMEVSKQAVLICVVEPSIKLELLGCFGACHQNLMFCGCVLSGAHQG